MMMATIGFIQGNSSTNSGDNDEESCGIIRKHDPSPPTTPNLQQPEQQQRNNNKCYKCRKSGEPIMMLLASYLLIFTVVTSFVTSQPVTNLQARNNKLMETPTQKATTTIPIIRGTVSSLPYYSYPSSSSSSSFYSHSNGNSIIANTADVGTSSTHFGKQGEEKAPHYLSPVLPLSIPVVQQQELLEEKTEELSNQFENGKDDVDLKTAAVESVNNPANHSPPPDSHNNNGNDNVLSMTLTNTLSSRSTGGSSSAFSTKERRKSSLEHVATRTVAAVEEGKKVGLAQDKDKVMLTDDVRGSSSTVNPVSSSSSSFPSKNGNSPPPPTPADPGAGELRVKINIISLEESKKDVSLQQHSKVNHNSNLNVNKSQRFMSTAVVAGREAALSSSTATPTEKQGELTGTTITTWRRKDDIGDGYYYGRDAEKKTSGYANVVNNHVNFVEEQQKMKEKQQGFDTDYSNKQRVAPTSTRVGKVDDDDESQSTNDKDNRVDTPTDSANGKSSFLSPTTASSADSSSTSPGNLMKSTRKSRPVTEMNSVSGLSPPVPLVQVSVDKKNKKDEKRSGENSKGQEKEEYNVHHQQSHHYSNDYSYDSPMSPLTGEDNGGNPPSPIFSASPSSSSSPSPLLMNKWIKTLVKLSQCRANCLDQAGIHHWDSSLGRSDEILKETHSDVGDDSGVAAAVGPDNQEKGEAGATRGASAPYSPQQLLPLPESTSTPNWSDLSKEEKPKTPVVYLEQMKEKKMNPLVRFPTLSTATPGRTIKVTPSSKSMKYYELSTCQELCQRKFPIQDLSSSQPELADDDIDDQVAHFTDFSNDKGELLTGGENKNGKNEDMVNSGNNSLITGATTNNNNQYHNSDASRTASGNNGNGNNGSNNNNTDNNNIDENIGKREEETPVERESSGSGASADRKSNNNQQHHPHQDYQEKDHYVPSSSSSAPEEEEEVEQVPGSVVAFGGGRTRKPGGSNNLALMMKLLAIEGGSADKNKSKQQQEQKHEHSNSKMGSSKSTTTGSLNNLKTFPSEPGLRVRQLSLKGQRERKDEEDDGDGVASTFSLSSASPILQLSWPKPSSWDRNDDDNNENNKPEGASPAAAQVKNEIGIQFDGGNVVADEKNKNEEGKAQRPVISTSSMQEPITVVYSIILEECWSGMGSGDGGDISTDGTRDTYYARRWKLINQTVVRTTTQISLPLEEKVQSEQKENEEKEKNNKNNNKEEKKVSLTEQKVSRIASGSWEAADASLEENKEEIIKMNGNKRNSEEGMMMTLKPLPLPSPPPSHQLHQQKKKPFLLSTDSPSKVTLRVLAVTREGLEKVYSAQVKVNISFWDYHLTEHHPIRQQVYREKEEENLNQREQADDSKTWTHAAASDSHNNKSISSSPAAAKFSHRNDDRDDEHVDKTGNQKKNGGGHQIEKVDKLDEKRKVEERGTGREQAAAIANFNASSNENSNQILVFPSKESLRQTMGVGRGITGEMKVKKLMSLLKQKKRKSENEVDHDNHLSNLIIASSPPALPPGREDAVVPRKPEIHFSPQEKDESESNNISNEVKIPSQKISLEQMTTTPVDAKDKSNQDENEEGPTQNWGLHTVSMIHQKFLVVTQVTWDYPGEEEEAGNGENDGTGSFSNNTAANANNETETAANKRNGGATKKIPSSASKKWRGCGSRASNSNAGSGVDTEKKEQEQQLNFLLSWEIFGGGIRGNLVTDTCSASISLWPDTAYIIQVGLITPNKMDPSSGGTEMTMTKTNGQDSQPSYASYLTAWQNSYNSKALLQSANTEANILSNHVPYISNYVDKNTEHDAAGHDENYDYKALEKSPGKENLQMLGSSSSTPFPSSFDPLVLPESITFPFDGEPKVTIKSERILVNTTRASKSNSVDGNDDNVDADENLLGSTIHNQDKVTPGNSQSNNNFPSAKNKKERQDGSLKKNKWNDEQEENDEQVILVKKNVGGSGSSSGGGGRNDSRRVSGINDKVNVSPITITRNGHTAGNNGRPRSPAFEEEELMLLQEENDQPESESLPRPSLYRHGKVEQTAASGVNEDADDAGDQDNSSVWSDEDEDEATDQDESLFARSLAHQNHQQHRHPPRSNDDNNNNNNIPPPQQHFRSVSLPQPHIQLAEGADQKQHNVPPKSATSKFHNFMTVNSFYQSLYALSRNALDLSDRYPNVITITNTNDGNGGGGGGGNKHSNGSSSSAALASTGIDPNLGPLLMGEFGNSNRTGYLFSGTHTGEDDDASGFKGKLYTLFVILVISFVIFLFIVAIVGFCVLTSSIKENYKYFVPKKVRVWTTVGQLFKGSNNQQGGSSSSSNEGGGGLFKDSAEGSFYPRRLQEEPDYEFDENEDFDPDDDEEEEGASSVAETDDEEEVESDCDCQCVIDNEIVEVEDEENSFSLNERRSSDTVKLIRDGEENSVELMAAVDEESDDNGVGESSSSCGGVGGRRSNSTSINNSHRCGGSHHRGYCDNNNPCYHTPPAAATGGGGGGRIFQSAISSAPTVKASPVAAALSSLRKNFHRVSSSTSSSASKQNQQQQQHQRNNHHRPHCPHYHQHHKRKYDTRIDVTGSSSRNARSLPTQRQEGYY